MKIFSVLLIALFATVIRCQETNVDEDSSVSTVEESGKEKRGISLNLGSGLEGYGYMGPSHSRGLYRGYSGGYAPMTEYAQQSDRQQNSAFRSELSTAPSVSTNSYDGVNYGFGAQNFAGGFQPGYSGYNSAYGNYPYGYRGGYPTSYQHVRQYNSPVNTYPLGGIGTVYPYGSSYSGFNTAGYNGAGYNGGGYNRLGYENNFGGYY